MEKDIAAGDEERLLEDLTRVQTAADKMQHLLKDLLSLARLNQQDRLERFALQTVVDEVLDIMQHSVTRAGLSVRVDPDLPWVTANKVQVSQVFQNLVENAIKFGRSDSREIHIGWRAGLPNVFFVADDGMGIEPRYQTRVFSLFERLDPSEEGTGVGLAIVKRIVSNHRGRVWIESDGENRGTTVCFTLSSES